MIELSAIVQCWAAMVAFRAAIPVRLAEETGWHPADADLPDDVWRTSCRAVGSLLMTGAFVLSVHTKGMLEGMLLAGAAAMFASMSVTLIAPLARRLVLVLAATCFAATPVAVVLTLVYGGSHGVG